MLTSELSLVVPALTNTHIPSYDPLTGPNGYRFVFEGLSHVVILNLCPITVSMQDYQIAFRATSKTISQNYPFAKLFLLHLRGRRNNAMIIRTGKGLCKSKKLEKLSKRLRRFPVAPRKCSRKLKTRDSSFATGNMPKYSRNSLQK